MTLKKLRTDNYPRPSALEVIDIDGLERLLGVGVCRQLGIYPIPAGFLLSVVVPVFNEQDTLHEIIRRIREVRIPKEIILVEDGSSDGTRNILKEFEGDSDVRVILHDRNRGKGAAIKTGSDTFTAMS